MHDSHAHLALEPLKSLAVEWVKDFKDKGGKYILNAAFDLESSADVIAQDIQFENKFPNTVLSSIGIHPEDCNLYNRKKINMILSELEKMFKNHSKRLKAVGETGLDYFHIIQNNLDNLEDIQEVQRLCFKKHIEIAKQYKLPLTIHSRDIEGSSMCVQDTLKILIQEGQGEVRGCFHSYTGNLESLKDIISLGFFVGFNGIITYPKAENVREILANTPLENILIETDCPYLPPQKIRRGENGSIKYCKPGDVVEIIETAAQIKNISVKKFIEITNTNFENLFLSN